MRCPAGSSPLSAAFPACGRADFGPPCFGALGWPLGTTVPDCDRRHFCKAGLEEDWAESVLKSCQGVGLIFDSGWKTMMCSKVLHLASRPQQRMLALFRSYL